MILKTKKEYDEAWTHNKDDLCLFCKNVDQLFPSRGICKECLSLLFKSNQKYAKLDLITREELPNKI